MFHGDIAKFSPADLLIFLAHLGKEGVLTVRHGEASLSVSFRRGAIVDAHCEAVDDLLVRLLRHETRAGEKALAYLERAREETGLPLRQICESVQWLAIRDLGSVLAMGVRETILRLFLLEGGEFQFAEIAVDANPFLEPIDAQGLTMDTVRLVDEIREQTRSLDADRRRPRATAAARGAGAAAEPAQRIVVELASGAHTVAELADRAPLRRADLLTALVAARDQGWIEMVESAGDAAIPAAADAPDAGRNASFHVYRRTLREMFGARDLQTRLRTLLAFGRDHLDCTLLLASRDGSVVGCRSWLKDAAGRLVTAERRPTDLHLDRDAVFRRAVESRVPFCGRVFPSDLLAALEITPPDAECALVPLGELDGMTLLVYGATRENAALLPYLELLAWHLQPPAPPPPRARHRAAAAASFPAAPVDRAADDDDPASRLVACIKELPPMPHVVSRILELLADPDCQMTDVTGTLALDPALVARLIKVSNSVLYGGAQKSSGLGQAIVRLGTRTTRNLVVAVSTRSLFPMDSSRVGLWGKALWQHSVECGIAARRVAEAAGGIDPDEAFVAGVLHDVGKVIVLLNQPDAFRQVKQIEETDKLASRVAERRILGFDHALVGARLLAAWEMPAPLVEAVRRHHEPGPADGLARVVACGNELSHGAGVPAGLPGELESPVSAAGAHAEALGLTLGRLDELRERVAADFASCDLFD